MAASTKLFDELAASLDSFLKEPSVFLRPQQDTGSNFKDFTKKLYDLGKRDEVIELPAARTLPSLIIENFDDEQIWQELELQHAASSPYFVQAISKLVTANKTGYKESFQNNNEVDDFEGHFGSADDSHLDDDDDYNEDDKDEDDELLDGSAFDNYDDDAMSDISIELEKALDKRIALDKGYEDRSELEDSGQSEDDRTQKPLDIDSDLLDTDGERQEATEKANESRKVRCTEVEDAFFKLAELERFLKNEDAKEERRIQRIKSNENDDDDDDIESIDYFRNIPSSENDDSDENDDDDDDEDRDNPVSEDGMKSKSIRKLKYNDFFDPPDSTEASRIKKTKLLSKKPELEDVPDSSASEDGNDSDESSPSDERQNQKSTFEMRQAKLKEKIRALEESNLSEKPWQLMGETSVATRPENSLLQEHLEFDHMTRQAPLITEDTTLKLENIITQRIKDQAWDDVERKVKPKEEPFEYKKRIVLDQEKNKLSLAEVYEQEYLKQQQSEKVEGDDEPEERKDIKRAMSSLFLKLDALCNFHFVPRPVVPEVKIVNNLPAIVVEEVAPVSTSEAALLAPEEIKEKAKEEWTGRSERSVTDRKRERRKKKTVQKARHKQAIARQKLVAALRPGLGNKYSKAAAVKQLKEEGKVTFADEDTEHNAKRRKGTLTSSKDFFTKLQEIQTLVGVKSSPINKKKFDKQVSTSKLKL